jgi:signal transduction histidine kinase/CheY-like chemotaxis protein
MSMAGPSTKPAIDLSEVRFLIEKNADGIIVVDESGVVLFANPASEAIFGRPIGSLIGSPIGIPFVVGDMTEISIHQPGGHLVDAEIRTVETTWDGRPARLASIRDVSGRRTIEERLRHAAKMEAVGRLTAGIAHDFNNLLTVVLGNLESAARITGGADVRLANALENATRGARQAASLTAKLLTFARQKPLESRLVDLKQLISSMSDLLQRTLGETIVVRTIIPEELWPVEVDPTELESALLNLAVNARDAMPDGGTLIIEAANVDRKLDDLSCAEEGTAGPHVLISVSDSGLGMTQQVLSRVFEPFFTTKPDGRGTGLGLSQVYGFVRQSGGDITLTSRPNAGTRVDIILPRTAASSEAPLLTQGHMQEGAVTLSGHGETILVVEDDEDVRAFTSNSLRELGYQVLEASDASTALELLESDARIDLLFTDLGLPGQLNGKHLGEHARKHRPTLRVLITTGYAGDALIHEGRLEPGVKLLSKPFSCTELGSRVRKLLDQQNAAPCVLVVEDEFLLRLFVTDMLSERGFVIEAAATFKEAVLKARSTYHELAAAVVDLGLPDRPGQDLIAELRALRPDLPIILATGYADDDIRQRLAPVARLQILTKPFASDDLMAALERIGVRF